MPLVMTPLMNVRREILFAARSLVVRLVPSGIRATSTGILKQLDGIPFFAYLMPESTHTQGARSNRRPPLAARPGTRWVCRHASCNSAPDLSSASGRDRILLIPWHLNWLGLFAVPDNTIPKSFRWRFQTALVLAMAADALQIFV